MSLASSETSLAQAHSRNIPEVEERMATFLYNLAELYRAHRRYVEAEPLLANRLCLVGRREDPNEDPNGSIRLGAGTFS
jgi:hypothetical protein